MQQINFTGSIEKETSVFFIIEEAKEIVLDFSKRRVKYIDFVVFGYNMK